MYLVQFRKSNTADTLAAWSIHERVPMWCESRMCRRVGWPWLTVGLQTLGGCLKPFFRHDKVYNVYGPTCGSVCVCEARAGQRHVAVLSLSIAQKFNQIDTLRLLVVEWYFRSCIFCRLLQPCWLFFWFEDGNPKTFRTSIPEHQKQIRNCDLNGWVCCARYSVL